MFFIFNLYLFGFEFFLYLYVISRVFIVDWLWDLIFRWDFYLVFLYIKNINSVLLFMV